MNVRLHAAVETGRPLILPLRTPLGYYFYDTNRNEIISVNKELFQYIDAVLKGDTQAIQSSDLDIVEQYTDLENAGYLSSKRVKEVNHSSSRILGLYLERGLESLVLQVTQNCNLRCGYCIYSEKGFNNQRHHSEQVMSWDIAKKAIDFFFEHSIDTSLPSIAFYGGEPLLNLDLIKQCVAYAKKVFEGRQLGFSTTTNGTILKDETLDFLVENEIKLMISLDGPKEIHDKNRRFGVNNQGSYDVVTKNIKRMIQRYPEYSKSVTINMVIDPQNDYEEINSVFLDESISMLKGMHGIVELPDDTDVSTSAAYSNASVYNRFLHLLHLAAHISEESLTRLSGDELAGTQLAMQKIKYSVLGDETAPGGPCIPGKMKLFVNCTGHFYPCEKVSEGSECQCIGSVDDGFDLEHANAILNIGKLTADECRNCWAFVQCNICTKKADDHGRLSADKKRKACKATREAVLSNIMGKIALYELYKFQSSRQKERKI